MQDRRKFIRVPFYEPVEYQRSVESALQGAAAKDISQMGLKLSINEYIAENTVVGLQIRLPGQTRIIPASAQVVWVRQAPYRDDAWDVGVRLIAGGETSAIQDYIGLRQCEIYLRSGEAE